MTRTKIMVMNDDGSGGGVDADVGSTRTQLMIWRLCNKCCPLFPIVMPLRPRHIGMLVHMGLCWYTRMNNVLRAVKIILSLY